MLGPIETCNSGSKHAVLHTQINRSSLGPIETCNSDPKVAVLNAKTTDEGWDQLRIVILLLIKLFCMHKTTGEVWDPLETINSGHNVAVVNAQNHR